MQFSEQILCATYIVTFTQVAT